MVPIVTRQNNKTALCEKELLIGARVELIVLECREGKEEEEDEEVEEEGDEEGDLCVK